MNDTPTALPGSSRSKYAQWWPILVGPVALVILILTAGQFGGVTVKEIAEPISPPILGLATVIFALRAWRTGNPLCWVLAGLGFAFTCREIHFTGTNTGIKVALAILIVWTILWRKLLIEAARNIPHSRWVAASALTYTLSKMVEKRLFRAGRLGIIPNEDAIHITLEEGMELVAHLLLLVAAVMGAWKAWGGEDQVPEPKSEAISE
ncbi:MAG: hypothetical protein QGH94_03350 [Phycisphaerae bacterium]|nr:hypothetical protein [Phycisphaerae bacterium]MDP7287012.1 hypothetical protein [Phycisphaerae bacterium]